MKRRGYFFAAWLCCLLLCACAGPKELEQWDCSVKCAKVSGDDYVITWSDQKVTTQTGALTFQNRNKFDIVVHLQADGWEESFDVYAGGCTVQLQLDRDTEYTVGCHADVAEDTEIKLMVYDGERSEVYISS